MQYYPGQFFDKKGQHLCPWAPKLGLSRKNHLFTKKCLIIIYFHKWINCLNLIVLLKLILKRTKLKHDFILSEKRISNNLQVSE